MPYHPQGLEEVNREWNRPSTYLGGDKGVNPSRTNSKLSRVIKHTGYPRQVLDFANPNSDVLHPTQKPVECMARPMRNHDAPEVYDPFLGSGTTMVAAQNLSRKCYGLEISPAYCAVILQRMADAFPGIEIRKADA